MNENEKKELNEQELEKVTGGQTDNIIIVTYQCSVCHRIQELTYTDDPTAPICCGEFMELISMHFTGIGG